VCVCARVCARALFCLADRLIPGTSSLIGCHHKSAPRALPDSQTLHCFPTVLIRKQGIVIPWSRRLVADSRSASQETLRFLWIPEFNFQVHKTLTMNLALSYLNPIHIFSPVSLVSI